MSEPVRVFAARRIVTMNASVPAATHGAVREGRILGLGTAADMAAFRPTALDDRFADKVLVPGFVEGHSHAAEGLMWRNLYVGYF
ncbi:MAG: amidohydrolase, partial [Rhodospirillales bacterium]|nr:amidohydrolase [Rhodospirillales bacterium]